MWRLVGAFRRRGFITVALCSFIERIVVQRVRDGYVILRCASFALGSYLQCCVLYYIMEDALWCVFCEKSDARAGRGTMTLSSIYICIYFFFFFFELFICSLVLVLVNGKRFPSVFFRIPRSRSSVSIAMLLYYQILSH